MNEPRIDLIKLAVEELDAIEQMVIKHFPMGIDTEEFLDGRIKCAVDLYCAAKLRDAP